MPNFQAAVTTGFGEYVPGPRGETIEVALGQNLPQSFKTIDIFDPLERHVVSIKSINFDDTTYQTASGIKSALNTHLRSLERFKGASLEGVTVRASDYDSKELLVAFPHFNNQWQVDILNEYVAIAESMGLKFTPVVF